MTTKNELDGSATGADVAATPKKRARIVKKDSDRVYSASQDQGERYDTVQEERAHKRASVALANDEKTAAIHALESEVLVPPRKTRGRPSKAYLEAQRAYEEALARRQNEIDETKAALAGNAETVVAERPTDVAPADAAADADVSVVETAPLASDSIAAPAADAEPIVASAVEQAAPAVAESAVVTPDSTVDDDDVPDFIKMQRAAVTVADSAEPTAEPEPVAPVAEAPVVEAAATIPTADSVAAAAPRRTLAQAYAEGQRFIIIEDVPVIDSDGYIFTAPQDTYEVPVDTTPATAEPIRFRRFKDDADVNPAVAAVDAAVTLVNSVMTPPAAPREAPVDEVVRLGDIVIDAEGVVEVDNQGNGYLRSSDYNYMPSPDDVFVSQAQVRNYALKTGDLVSCRVRAPKEGEKYYALKEVISINGCAPHAVRDRIAFEHLIPLFPDEQFRLSKKGTKAPLSCRIVDLFAPIGKGQRALIVAQPKTGKTILMKQIANAIAANYPDTYLMMLLIDERPEEVTDMARTVNAEVIASTFDEPAKRHVRIANMVLEKAKRMVECGRDVVIFLDSITRLARAFNTEAPASGKILTGGVDANALQKPKRFFGAARNIEGGGSLTIIATALIDTGSKMDEVIFEEFKGTGNMELQLDRNLANKRIFPAVNLVQSSTRREDLLLDDLTINRMFITRNYMADMSPIEAMNFIRKHLESTISNEEFITTMGG